jgi:NTP pyrophosphatase (non-canonical NTP hydrolase)
LMEQENVAAIHANAKRKGFWGTIDLLDAIRSANVVDKAEYDSRAFEFYAKQCMMLVSEVTELMEALRKEKGQHEVESEAADIFIRLADLYEGLRTHGLADKTLFEAVSEKTVVNAQRPEKHGVLG